MRGAILALLCVIALSNAKIVRVESGEDKIIHDDPSEAPAICAKDDSEGVLVAHEICTQFYKCSKGLPVSLYCPSNLLYNPQQEYCDWPMNVECGDRALPDNENNENDGSDNGGNINEASNCDPSAAPVICAKAGSDGVLVANEQCNKFYKCFQGLPVALSCPSSLLYDPIKELCDWSENVVCGDRTLPGDKDDEETGDDNEIKDDNEINDNTISGNCDPSEAPAICAKEGSDGVLVANERCTKFYKCFEGVPVTLSCPSGLLYNPQREYCDWPSNVVCGDRIIPDDDEEEETGSDNGGNGDQEIINCDPSQAPAICAEEGSDGVLVAHEKCNNFYKCSEGHPVALTCPQDLLYDPIRQQCDWADQVQCGDRENEEEKEDNYDPSQAPTICAAKESNGVLVAHERCNYFYQCSGGLPVELKCPKDLLFNSKVWRCDWPQRVVCGDRYIPEEEDEVNDIEEDKDVEDKDEEEEEKEIHCDPSQAPAICAAKGSDGTLVAHENCNQFYMCAKGLTISFMCPPGLLYNPPKEQCDWPQSVTCDSRVIPDDSE